MIRVVNGCYSNKDVCMLRTRASSLYSPFRGQYSALLVTWAALCAPWLIMWLCVHHVSSCCRLTLRFDGMNFRMLQDDVMSRNKLGNLNFNRDRVGM